MGEFLTVEKQRDYLAEIPEEMKDAALQDLIDRGHELEGINTEFSALDAVVNIPGSLLEFGKNIVSAVANPRQTLKGVSAVADGAVRSGVRNILGIELSEGQLGSEEDEKAFHGMVDFFAERYGGGERILETIERDPAGFLSDAATLIGGLGGGVSLAGKLGKAGKLADLGAKTSKASRLLDPVVAIPKAVKTVTTKPAKAAVRAGLKATGFDKVVNRISAKSMGDVIDASATDVKNIIGSAGRNPLEWMVEHGIGGSLEKMKFQVDHIAEVARNKLDTQLSKVTGKFKHRDTQVLLNELRNSISREFADSGSQSGATLRIPRENLSDEMLRSLDEINALIAKGTNEGLDLVDIQRTKRISDDFLDIFKTSGEAKSGARFKNLETLRRSTRKFIERTGEQNNIPNVRKLNQETQLATGLGKIINKRIATGKTRTPKINRLQGIILGGGVVGAIAAGQVKPFVTSLGILGATEILRIPAVKSYWSTRLRLLSMKDFKALESMADTGKPTSRAMKVIQRERDRFRQILPELRLGGIVQEQQQEATQ